MRFGVPRGYRVELLKRDELHVCKSTRHVSAGGGQLSCSTVEMYFSRPVPWSGSTVCDWFGRGRLQNMFDGLVQGRRGMPRVRAELSGFPCVRSVCHGYFCRGWVPSLRHALHVNDGDAKKRHHVDTVSLSFPRSGRQVAGRSSRLARLVAWVQS